MLWAALGVVAQGGENIVSTLELAEVAEMPAERGAGLS